MSIKLYLEKNGALVGKYAIHEGNELTIGKSGNQNTIDLDDSAVSRKHASITYKNGNAVLTDLGSTNLTLVNGKPATANQPYPLNNGDKIKVAKNGQFEIRLEFQQPVSFQWQPLPKPVSAHHSNAVIGTLELFKNGNLMKTTSVMPGKKIVLGRPGFGNEIELDDITVSKHHAKIESAGEHMIVYDLGSTNKTFLNGNALIPNQPGKLKNGDRIKISGKGIYELNIRLKESKQPGMENSQVISMPRVEQKPPVIRKEEQKPIVKVYDEPAVGMKKVERVVKDEPAKLVPYRKFGKWGFADPGRIILIPVIYDEAKPFYQGRAAVKSNGKWAFLDEQGETVIPFKYEDVSNFSNGFAAFKSSGKWGFINKEGKEVVFPKYSTASEFKESISLVSLNRKWGAIDTQGYEICAIKYDSIANFEEGMSSVSAGGKWGFINQQGKEVIPLKFAKAGNFSEGLAPVKMDDWQNSQFGYIDKSGREAIPAKYASAMEFTENLARVSFDKKWGFIDRKGNVKIPIEYKNAAPYSFGLAPVASSNFLWLEEKWGVIDKEGLEVVPFNYDNAGFYVEEIAPVKTKGRWGFIDRFGNMLISPKFEKIFLPDGSEFNNHQLLNYFKGGLIAVQFNGRKGFVDTKGNEVVPPKFSEVKSFSNGIAYVEMNGAGGYVDAKGQEFFE